MAPVVRLALICVVVFGIAAGALTRVLPQTGQATADPALASAGPWGRLAPTAPGNPGRPSPSGPSRPMVVGRDGGGMFHLSGQINGLPVQFLVDTGADLVSIPAEQADSLGLVINHGENEATLATASGTAQGTLVKLERLEVAGTELHDVDAVVVNGLHMTLLGQSALRRLGKVEMSGDSLVISPN